MIGALRFVLRDTKDSRLAAKGDFRCVVKAAAPRGGGCSPARWRLQPCVAEAATLRARLLESALGGLSGELKKIQGGGSDLFKGPLMPFSKTAALLFEVSTLQPHAPSLQRDGPSSQAQCITG